MTLSPSDISRIRKLRAAGKTWSEIGVVFGRASSTMCESWKALGGITKNRPTIAEVRAARLPAEAPAPSSIPSVTRWVPLYGLSVASGSPTRVPVSLAHVSLIDGPRP